VNAVYIDGDPAGGQLIGGVQASIVSETAKQLVVTVPPGASTGLLTLVGWSGDVTSSSAFTVTGPKTRAGLTPGGPSSGPSSAQTTGNSRFVRSGRVRRSNGPQLRSGLIRESR
jgi:hypothetical protein